MRYLSLMLLGPWLLILAWVYWSFPRSLPRQAWRRAFDVVVLAIAALASIGSALDIFDATAIKQIGHFGRESGSIWKQVVPALYGYGWFIGVLSAGMVIRQLIWNRKRARIGCPQALGRTVE